MITVFSQLLEITRKENSQKKIYKWYIFGQEIIVLSGLCCPHFAKDTQWPEAGARRPKILYDGIFIQVNSREPYSSGLNVWRASISFYNSPSCHSKIWLLNTCPYDSKQLIRFPKVTNMHPRGPHPKSLTYINSILESTIPFSSILSQLCHRGLRPFLLFSQFCQDSVDLEGVTINLWVCDSLPSQSIRLEFSRVPQATVLLHLVPMSGQQGVT